MDAAPDSIADQPRLGVVHLLVWMTVSAVYLGAVRAIWPVEPAEVPTFSLVLMSLNSLSAGVMLGGLVLWFARKRRGMAFPVYPGEWLMVALGGHLFLYLVLWSALALFVPDDELLYRLYSWRVHNVLGMMIFSIPVVRLKTPLRWRLFFVAIVVQEAMRFLVGVTRLHFSFGGYESYKWSYMADHLLGLLSRLVLLGVLAIDLRAGLRRPWPHWAGIIAQLLSGALGFASVIWLLLAGPFAP